jgi:hypothetical protein
MTTLLGVLFIPYRTSTIHPTFQSRPKNHRPRRLNPARSGSGIVPERALKAIKPTPRAKRESPSFPEPSCERRTGFAEPPKTAAERRGAHSKPQRSGIVPERALKAIKPTPRAKRESSSFPEPSCERRNGSAEPYWAILRPMELERLATLRLVSTLSTVPIFRYFSRTLPRIASRWS